MSIVSAKAVARTLNKRSTPHRVIDLQDHLFDKQLAFVRDPSAFKVGICSRRAGKTTSIAADLVTTAASTPDCTAMYITSSRVSAKKIIWDELLKFNRKEGLGGVPNTSELKISYPNGSVVRLEGAKDENEINKIRGQLPPIKKAFIDEAQSIRDSILKTLIDDVLEAALLDYAGSLIMIGTPGAIKTGYFYRICHNLDEDNKPLVESPWAVHSWTFFDNPFVAQKSRSTHEEMINRVLKRRGVTREHPSIQREFYGKWVNDSTSLLIHYSDDVNHFDSISTAGMKKWNHIMGVDVGFNDSDAIAILAYHDDSPTTYLVEEIVTPKQGITELAEQMEKLRVQYDVSKIVMDMGALGKKIGEEIIRRHQIHVEPAEKQRKMENVEFLNDALRTGRFKAKRNSKFAQDAFLVEIDKNKSTPDKTIVSNKYHSDIIDAVLYSFKLSPAYAYQTPVKQPDYGTAEWAKKQEEIMFETAREEFERLQAEEEENQGYGY